MKKLFTKYKSYFFILLATVGFFVGCQNLFETFGSPEGNEAKYPLFLLTISLVAIYMLPMLVFIRYLAKRYSISQSLINLSWLLGLTANFAFSEIGHEIVGYFWLYIVKADEQFLNDWGAAVSAPFAEEIAKGIVVLLVLAILSKWSLKNALVSGMIVGLSFQVIEDCIYVFNDMFKQNMDGFVTILERISQAGASHWTFTALFGVGAAALFTKNSGLSKMRSFLFLFASIFLHFLYNSPFNVGSVTLALMVLNFTCFLLAFKSVDRLTLSKKSNSLA